MEKQREMEEKRARGEDTRELKAEIEGIELILQQFRDLMAMDNDSISMI